ncbi:MAG TPA: hypothetical protein VMZ25_00435 [Terriglobales bacterium]|nr:hypothetical protein [Terriglobales bacterium]
MNSYFLSKSGSMIAGGGIVWAVYAATRELDMTTPTFLEQTLRNIFMQTGPLEVCGAGVVIWLFGKWRSSIS